MRAVGLRLLRSNRALESYYRDQISIADLAKRREAVRICVIDDEPFQARTNLLTHGYRVDEIGDVATVSSVLPYGLVLCDIIGVGRRFDDELQGASIISEIRRAHPEKIVVAFTAATMSLAATQKARDAADDVIKKDIKLSEWVNRLDQYIIRLLNPYLTWERIRAELVSRGLDTKDILILEDRYVRSILKRDPDLKPLQNLLRTNGSKEDIRNIVNGLVSSAIFKLIAG